MKQALHKLLLALRFITAVKTLRMLRNFKIFFLRCWQLWTDEVCIVLCLERSLSLGCDEQNRIGWKMHRAGQLICLFQLNLITVRLPRRRPILLAMFFWYTAQYCPLLAKCGTVDFWNAFILCNCNFIFFYLFDQINFIYLILKEQWARRGQWLNVSG